jgi:hypothetical protein
MAGPSAVDDAWGAAFDVAAAAPDVDIICAAGGFVLVTVTAAVDVDKFCAAGAFGFVVVFVLATAVAAVDVDKFCTAGTFGFVFATGGFGAGAGGVGLFMMAEAVPQTLAMVNAAKARVMGNERRIFLVSGFVRRSPPRT